MTVVLQQGILASGLWKECSRRRFSQNFRIKDNKVENLCIQPYSVKKNKIRQMFPSTAVVWSSVCVCVCVLYRILLCVMDCGLFRYWCDPQKQPVIQGSWTLEPAYRIYTTCQVLRHKPRETSLFASHTLLQPQIGQVSVCPCKQLDSFLFKHWLLYTQMTWLRLNSAPLTGFLYNSHSLHVTRESEKEKWVLASTFPSVHFWQLG